MQMGWAPERPPRQPHQLAHRPIARDLITLRHYRLEMVSPFAVRAESAASLELLLMRILARIEPVVPCLPDINQCISDGLAFEVLNFTHHIQRLTGGLATDRGPFRQL